MQKEESSSSKQETPVIVIGENCKDKFVYGHCNRMCPEAPVPVFKPTGDITINDGMAGNVASNVRSLGYPCHHIHNSGDTIKTRYIDYRTNQMLLRVDDNDYSSPLVIEGLTAALVASADLVIVSDYDKGLLTEATMKEIFELNPNCFLDTKKRLRASWAGKARCIKINEPEFEATRDSISQSLMKKIVITRGDAGCDFQGETYPPRKALQTIDVSGAGDTFIAGLATKWLETRAIKDSIDFANECAHKVIQQRGVTAVEMG